MRMASSGCRLLHMSGPPLQVSAEEVRVLRKRMKLSQSEFARLLRLPLMTVKNWEQGRRLPTGPSASLLRIFDREPRATLRALHGVVPNAVAELITKLPASES